VDIRGVDEKALFESIDPVEEDGIDRTALVGIELIFRADWERASAAGLSSLVDRCIFAYVAYYSLFEYVV
jgi:hypothetical protein